MMTKHNCCKGWKRRSMCQRDSEYAERSISGAKFRTILKRRFASHCCLRIVSPLKFSWDVQRHRNHTERDQGYTCDVLGLLIAIASAKLCTQYVHEGGRYFAEEQPFTRVCHADVYWLLFSVSVGCCMWG